MCLVVFAVGQRADWPLILLANRDEFRARPSAPLQAWPERDGVHAGRDLQAGGTWLGLRRTAANAGRLALVTNIRQGRPEPDRRSRGELPLAFLQADSDPLAHAAGLTAAGEYNGFNLLAAVWRGDQLQLACGSNRRPPQPAGPGLWALSNAGFDTPWPKTLAAKAALEALLATAEAPHGHWLDALTDAQPAADHELPDTGIPRDWERRLSAMLITGEDYGTVCQTLVAVHASGRVRVAERWLDANGRPQQARTLEL